jgi:tetratricopeptide (TPR) repeat protein
MTCSSSTTFTPRLLLAALAGLLLGAAQPAAVVADKAIARGDGVSAEVAIREAVKGGTSRDALRAAMGEALMLEGNLGEARKWLGGSFAPGTEGRGWRARGRLELAQGNLGAAGQAFDQALRHIPRDPLLWVDIARLRYAGGEQIQAVAAASQAVALGPKNVRALELKGMLVREQYGLVASLPWFEAALEQAPKDKSVLGEYAATLGDIGNYRDMLVVCRKLAQVDPGNPRALYLQAVLAARAGQTGLARSIMLKTGESLRDMPAAILLNGVLEYRAGNLNLAIEHFDRLLRMQPDNREAGELLARALAQSGDDRQVVERFVIAADRPGSSTYLMSIVAHSLDRVKRGRDAALFRARIARGEAQPFTVIPPGAPLGVLALRQADDPGKAATVVPYVRALLAAGRGGDALALALQLRNANPGAADAHLLAGDVRIMLGDPAGAVADWREAARIRLTAPLLQRLATGLRMSGDPVMADKLIAAFLNQHPQSILAKRLLAVSATR